MSMHINAFKLMFMHEHGSKGYIKGQETHKELV